jgi:hypothetical protein
MVKYRGAPSPCVVASCCVYVAVAPHHDRRQHFPRVAAAAAALAPGCLGIVGDP